LLIEALTDVLVDFIKQSTIVLEKAKTVPNVAHTRGAKLSHAVGPVARSEHKRNAPGERQKADSEKHVDSRRLPGLSFRRLFIPF
jgi:hypothetical protein